MEHVGPPAAGPLDPSWIRPLHDVTSRLSPSDHWSDEFFDLDDFMIMARVTGRRGPDIVLYKHVYTRRYLNLDASVRAYRYRAPAPASTGSGRYVRHATLRDGLEHLELWELPWMKRGLERFRHGLDWEDRWHVFDLAAESFTDRPGFGGGDQDGGLHLV